MRILVIGQNYINYTWSVANALSQMGNYVVTHCYDKFAEGSSYLIRKAYKLGIRSLEQKYYADLNLQFQKKYDEVKPDVCFIINGDTISSQTLENWRNNGTTLVLWLIDSIVRLPASEHNLKYYHRCASFEPQDREYLAKKYNINCEYVPVGYETNIYRPDDTVCRDVDISFVGIGTPNRLKALTHVARYCKDNNKKLMVYGIYWNYKYPWQKSRVLGAFRDRYSPLQEFVHNGFISPVEAASIYQRSKICLNIHVPEHSSVNPRTFEILGTRSFQLIDDRAGLTDFLKPGIDLQVYDSASDLISKIDYYLNNDIEREKIAINGWETARDCYSIKSILKDFLKF